MENSPSLLVPIVLALTTVCARPGPPLPRVLPEVNCEDLLKRVERAIKEGACSNMRDIREKELEFIQECGRAEPEHVRIIRNRVIGVSNGCSPNIGPPDILDLCYDCRNGIEAILAVLGNGCNQGLLNALEFTAMVTAVNCGEALRTHIDNHRLRSYVETLRRRVHETSVRCGNTPRQEL